MTVTDRQPRERSVLCIMCHGRHTFNVNAVCDRCEDREGETMTKNGNTRVAPGRKVGANPIHTFRPDPAVWAAAKERAAAKGETVTDVLNRALERYVK